MYSRKQAHFDLFSLHVGQAVHNVDFFTLSKGEQVERTRNYLNCDKQADTSTHLRWVSIHSGHYIDNRLSDGNDHSKHCIIKRKKYVLVLEIYVNGQLEKYKSLLCREIWEGIHKSQDV